MTRIQRSALLPYSAEQLFELVNDIEAYPDFMDGCVKAEILSRDENSLTARLNLKKGGVNQSFTTRNQLHKPDKIILELAEGPFDSLRGEWVFTALASQACKISLDLSFNVQHSLIHNAAEKLFESVAGNLVNSLCQRAQFIYPKPS